MIKEVVPGAKLIKPPEVVSEKVLLDGSKYVETDEVKILHCHWKDLFQSNIFCELWITNDAIIDY